MSLQVRYAIVLDDHPMVVRGIEEFLKSNLRFDAVYSANTSVECLILIEAYGPPSLLITDFWLPDQATVTFIARIRQLCPQTTVLVISGDNDPAIRNQVRASSANGFVLKQESPEVFATAVNAVLAGAEWFISDSTAQRYEGNSHQLSITYAELELTSRQGQILSMILQGLPNKRIATQLSLAESTVKEHVSSILYKLGARNRVEVITKLRGHKLVPA